MDETEATNCSDYSHTRRRFLGGVSALTGAGVLSTSLGGVFRQVAFAGDVGSDGNILVMLSLRGGADGLSMVVPYADPAYLAARPTIAVPSSQLIAKDGFFGLHPSFAPMESMWNAGSFAAVHAVGLPAPNRSHFAAMEELEEADPGSHTRVGWLNRLIGLDVETSPREAVQLGSPMVPTSLYGTEEVLAFTSIASVALPGGAGIPGTWKRNSLNSLWGTDQGPLGRAGRATLSASADIVGLDSSGPQNGARYPATPLGRTLADSVRLIRGQLGAEVITIDFGGWDMHVNVGTLDHGAMTGMVSELAKGIAAFFADLGTLASKVTLVTITEFGRRVMENGNKGLDHGYGNAMFLAGAGVSGGQYYGQWPGLGTEKLLDGDLRVTRDYRSILSEVLRDRFNANMSVVFPGFQPEGALGVMRS